MFGRYQSLWGKLGISEVYRCTWILTRCSRKEWSCKSVLFILIFTFDPSTWDKAFKVTLCPELAMGWRWIDCKYFSHLAVSKNNCFSSYVSEYKSQVFVPTANWFLTLSRCHWHNTKTVLISWNLNKYLVRAANTYHEQTKIANLVKISWFVLTKLVSFLAPKQSVIKANSTHF